MRSRKTGADLRYRRKLSSSASPLVGCLKAVIARKGINQSATTRSPFEILSKGHFPIAQKKQQFQNRVRPTSRNKKKTFQTATIARGWIGSKYIGYMGVGGAILLKFGSGHRRSGQKQKLLPHSLEPPVAQQGQVVTAVEHQGVLLGTRYVNPPDGG